MRRRIFSHTTTALAVAVLALGTTGLANGQTVTTPGAPDPAELVVTGNTPKPVQVGQNIVFRLKLKAKGNTVSNIVVQLRVKYTAPEGVRSDGPQPKTLRFAKLYPGSSIRIPFTVATLPNTPTTARVTATVTGDNVDEVVIRRTVRSVRR